MDHNESQNKYKGWVPTVGGRLSFNFVGHSNHPTRSVAANVADKSRRYLICYQKRSLLDSNLPFKNLLSPVVWGLRGRYWFLCLASASNQPTDAAASMAGDLFIYHSKPAWRRSVEPAVRDAQRMLQDLQKLENTTLLGPQFQRIFDDLAEKVWEAASFRVTFSLARNGEAEISIPDIFKASPSTPQFPDDPEERAHMEHMVCAQLFFFLKDITHTHQHHDPHTDTMVDLYPVKEGDDYGWRCETLRALYRKILEFKRFRLERVNSSALGILAYAKSFKEISTAALSGGSQPHRELNPLLNEKLLEESIRASQQTLQNTTQERIRNADVARNVIIAGIGLLLPLIGLLQLVSKNVPIGTPNILLVTTAKFLLKTNPWYTFGLVTLVYVAASYMHGITDIANRVLARRLLMLLQPLNIRVAMGILLIAAAIVAEATVSIVFSFSLFGTLLGPVLWYGLYVIGLLFRVW